MIEIFVMDEAETEPVLPVSDEYADILLNIRKQDIGKLLHLLDTNSIYYHMEVEHE